MRECVKSIDTPCYEQYLEEINAIIRKKQQAGMCQVRRYLRENNNNLHMITAYQCLLRLD